MNIKMIDTNTAEGMLLMAAISQLSLKCNKTPQQCLDDLDKIAMKMYNIKKPNQCGTGLNSLTGKIKTD